MLQSVPLPVDLNSGKRGGVDIHITVFDYTQEFPYVVDSTGELRSRTGSLVLVGVLRSTCLTTNLSTLLRKLGSSHGSA